MLCCSIVKTSITYTHASHNDNAKQTTATKGNTMNSNEIKTVLIAANVACSVKQIAKLLQIDAPSEVLRGIKDACWEMVDTGALQCTTVTETEEQFFSVV